MSFTLGELAQRFGGRVKGDPNRRISSVAPLEAAGPSDISFLANPRLSAQLHRTRAGAVILDEAAGTDFAGDCLVVENPYACFARIADLLHPLPRAPAGVHPSAVVAPEARVDPSAAVGPHAVVEAGAHIGARVQIGPGCWIGAQARIGDDTRLEANVSVYARSRVGRRCLVCAGAVIGSEGFGHAREGARWIRIPQLGRVIIGDDVRIGANTTIDRGTLADTVIEEGVKLDNLIQIAHNVRIGAHTAMAGCVAVAGSAVIGRRCTFGGRAGVLGHLEIVDDVHVTATSLVTHSIRRPGVYSSVLPLEEAKRWRRAAVRVKQLDEMARRLKRLEEHSRQPDRGRKD